MNLEEQISKVLSDPEAMSKISSIAGSLGLQSPQQNTPADQTPPFGNLPDLRLPELGGDDRAKLLMALKPFLSEKRAPYVDGAVAMLSIMKLSSLNGSLGNLLSSLGGKPKA